MRTTSAEMEQLGEILGKKVSEATGPTAVFIPRRGVSAIDVEGGPFYDTDADSACSRSFSQTVSEGVAVEDRDEHINNPSFAEAMARRLIEMMEANR